MEFTIAYIAGDGAGPEIMDAALAVLARVGDVFGHEFRPKSCLAGGEAVATGHGPLPAESQAICNAADAVLLGPVQFGTRDDLPPAARPEAMLGLLRRAIGVQVNLRPIMVWPELAGLSPLCAERIAHGFDLLLVRDLSQGLLGAERGRERGDAGEVAWDRAHYDERAIRTVAQFAFDAARGRRCRVASLDKAVVLESSRLWREVVEQMATEESDLQVSSFMIDDAAAKLIDDPSRFDVVVTSGMFGDIFADEAAALTGAPYLLASAEIAPDGRGIYTPNQIHATGAFEAGKANPLGLILAVAQMLRFSFHLPHEAQAVECAVREAVQAGVRTIDLVTGPSGTPATSAAQGAAGGDASAGAAKPGGTATTSEMTRAVCERIRLRA